MLSVRGLKKTFKAREAQAGVSAVNDISFDVKEGNFFTLLGPSGCGKSTILQSIAGLENSRSAAKSSFPGRRASLYRLTAGISG
jgi:ABC-type Fe3+/spermidine/putrescine transport system ATPase subunit